MGKISTYTTPQLHLISKLLTIKLTNRRRRELHEGRLRGQHPAQEEEEERVIAEPFNEMKIAFQSTVIVASDVSELLDEEPLVEVHIGRVYKMAKLFVQYGSNPVGNITPP